MWKLIAGILQLILLLAQWWGVGKPRREEQDGGQDIVDGDTDAVSVRIDGLLTKARDHAKRGKDNSGMTGGESYYDLEDIYQAIEERLLKEFKV